MILAKLTCPRCNRFLARYRALPGVVLETNCHSCKSTVVVYEQKHAVVNREEWLKAQVILDSSTQVL